MKQIKQIFLDLDGPLLDGKLRHFYCYSKILHKYGFTPIGINEYWEKKKLLLNRRELLKLSNAESIYDEYLSEWIAAIETSESLALDEVQDDALKCLQTWKSLDIKLFLVTLRKNKEAVAEQLYLKGFTEYLDEILICDHVSGGTGKANAVREHPNIDIMPDNSIWIGDTEVDWEAARSLGMNIILVGNGLRDRTLLDQMPGGKVVESIKDSMKLFGLTLNFV